MLIAFFIGLAIAGLWGLTAIASSHVTISTSRSSVIAQGSSMLVLLLFGMAFPMGGMDFSHHSLSSTLVVLVGLGLLGGLGYFSLQKAFQSSLPVGQVSSLTTGSYAVSTLLSWLMFHDVNLASILLLLCGVVLVAGAVSKESPSHEEAQERSASLAYQNFKGVVWAMVAAACLGLFNFGLGFSSSMTGAWYVSLLGSRAISLLILSLVLAGSQDDERDKEHTCWLKNMLLAVGIGVAETLGLLGLCLSTETDQPHLTMILAVSSCSVLLPFCYSIFQGMRLSFTHMLSLFLILLGLVTLKDLQATSLSTTALVLLVVPFVVFLCVRTLSLTSKRSTRPITLALEPVRVAGKVLERSTAYGTQREIGELQHISASLRWKEPC
jgi:drug/metabolite transporter (DMT)-like permease